MAAAPPPPPQYSAAVPQLNENNNAIIQRKEIDVRTSRMTNSIVLLGSPMFGNRLQLHRFQLPRSTQRLNHKSRMPNSRDHLHNHQPSSCQLDVRRDCISGDVHTSFTYLRCTPKTAREGSHQLQ